VQVVVGQAEAQHPAACQWANASKGVGGLTVVRQADGPLSGGAGSCAGGARRERWTAGDPRRRAQGPVADETERPRPTATRHNPRGGASWRPL
jgi:hypothetical protein